MIKLNSTQADVVIRLLAQRIIELEKAEAGRLLDKVDALEKEMLAETMRRAAGENPAGYDANGSPIT